MSLSALVAEYKIAATRTDRKRARWLNVTPVRTRPGWPPGLAQLRPVSGGSLRLAVALGGCEPLWAPGRDAAAADSPLEA